MLDECDREQPGLVCGEPTNGICSLFKRDALIRDDGGRSTLKNLVRTLEQSGQA